MQETAQKRPLVQLLEKPGEENRRLETILSYVGHDNFSEPVPLETGEDKKCALCSIYRMPFQQSEMVVNETDDFYIVDTEDRKGHRIRNMGVIKDHGVIPPVTDSVEMIDQLVESTGRQVLHEYEKGELESPDFIVYGSMNTFSEDFHLAASDIYGKEKPEDLERINSYLRFEYDGEDFNLNMADSAIRDSFGEYLERWVEETELV